jgi:hypothetical protein
MSSSVIQSVASVPVPAAVPVTTGAVTAAAPGFHGIARVELLLAAATADEADTEIGRVAAACGLGGLGRPRDGVTPSFGVPTDAAPAAVDLGGVLRHVAVLERRDGFARWWRGLAVVPDRHLLAAVPPGHAALVIRPASRPAVLLATSPPWPEDVLAGVARFARDAAPRRKADDGADAWSAPRSSAWMVGLTFPHGLPPAAFVEQLIAGAGVPVRRLMLPPDSRPASRCWAELDPTPCADVARALAALHRVHRVVGQSWVVL